MMIPKTISRRQGPRESGRVRCPAHLAFVAQQPCAVPGCSRAVQVHHLTHAAPKARGLKSPDSATVPLCAEHHTGQTGVHHRGDERAWWLSIGVDPLALAERLWRERTGES
jgi:hypothetical protein